MELLLRLENESTEQEWDRIGEIVGSVQSEFQRVVEFRDARQGKG